MSAANYDKFGINDDCFQFNVQDLNDELHQPQFVDILPDYHVCSPEKPSYEVLKCRSCYQESFSSEDNPDTESNTQNDDIDAPEIVNHQNKRSIFVPFANINIFDTGAQFYIEVSANLGFPSFEYKPRFVGLGSQLDLGRDHKDLNHNRNNVNSSLNTPVSNMCTIFNTRLETETAPEPVSVVNLSDRPLTQTELKVLSLGKGFCPTPGEPNMGEIKADLERLHSTCRKKFFFHRLNEERQNKGTPLSSSNSSPNVGTGQGASETLTHRDGLSANLLREKIFRKPTKWVPPRGPPTFETFATLNEMALNKVPIRAPHYQNLDQNSKASLKSLARDPSLVIKQADKGGALVVWDKAAYIKEGHRQLSDTNFYRRLDHDPTEKFNSLINNFVGDLYSAGSITADIRDALTTEKARTPEFYLLPKIHKQISPPPGRPIVSGNGSPTEKISAFVDFLLKPYVPLIESYVRDTNHVLERLSTLKGLGPDTILTS